MDPRGVNRSETPFQLVNGMPSFTVGDIRKAHLKEQGPTMTSNSWLDTRYIAGTCASKFGILENSEKKFAGEPDGFVTIAVVVLPVDIDGGSFAWREDASVDHSIDNLEYRSVRCYRK